MAYLSTEELTQRAQRKNLDISAYTDDELTDLIDECQTIVEEQTGRIFEKRQITERFTRFDGTSLQLRWYPVLPGPEMAVNEGPFVDSLTIDGQNLTWYLQEPDYGIIVFDMPIFNWGPYRVNNLVIKYTTCPFLDDPDKVHPAAKRLVADMCMYEISKRPDGLKPQSVKEGDLSMSFQAVDWIQERIDALRRPFMAII